MYIEGVISDLNSFVQKDPTFRKVNIRVFLPKYIWTDHSENLTFQTFPTTRYTAQEQREQLYSRLSFW